MTDLTERERQIVAWLRDRAKQARDEWLEQHSGTLNERQAFGKYAGYKIALDAIERGEHLGEQA